MSSAQRIGWGLRRAGGTSGSRRLVGRTDQGEVWERQTTDGPVYEVVRPEACHFATLAAAKSAAAGIGSHVFLAAGEVAPVARGVDGGDLADEVHTAEVHDRRYVGSTAHAPGDVTRTHYAEQLDEALDAFLGVALAPPPEPADERERRQSESVSTPARYDLVRRDGTRVTRAEWSAACPDGIGLCSAGRAVVAECATVEDAKARFWDCVAGLRRVAAGQAPDPAVIGVTVPPLSQEEVRREILSARGH
jgi:hypothetical protein